jgi:hypothetical protein
MHTNISPHTRQDYPLTLRQLNQLAAMLKNVPNNYNHNQTNPKLQPKHKNQLKTQSPDVVVHTKKRTTTTKQ